MKIFLVWIIQLKYKYNGDKPVLKNINALFNMPWGVLELRRYSNIFNDQPWLDRWRSKCQSGCLYLSEHLLIPIWNWINMRVQVHFFGKLCPPGWWELMTTMLQGKNINHCETTAAPILHLIFTELLLGIKHTNWFNYPILHVCYMHFNLWAYFTSTVDSDDELF